jgi:hypothetical protein
MPFPASAPRCDVQRAGAVTAGNDVTSVAGCHGGGEGGNGACGGTGQPARATGAEVVDVVVDGAAGAGERAAGPIGRVVGAGRARGGGTELATRPGPFETAGGGEPDVAANVATDTTAAKNASAAAGHQRFTQRDTGTSHSRDPPARALDTQRRGRQRGRTLLPR